MITVHKQIHLDKLDRMVKFRNLTDVHVGDSAVNYIKLYKDLQNIKDDEFYFFGLGGDNIEAFNRNEKRYDHEHEAKFCYGSQDIVSAQIEYLIGEVEPAKKSMVYMLSGNHESTLLSRDQRDVMKELSRAFKAPYLGIAGYVVLDFIFEGKAISSLTIYAHHGTSSSQTKSGNATALEKQFLFHPRADLILMGHSHTRQYIEHVSVVPFNGSIRKNSRYSAFCGSYKDHIIDNNNIERDWAISKGFPPSLSKSYLIEIYPSKGVVRLIEDL